VEAVLRDVQHCERCGERLVSCSSWVEVHDGVEAAWDTSSEGILGVAGHTSVAAGIDVDDAAADAAEALAVRADVAQGIASTRAEAASTDPDDSCTEAAAETSAHSP
jgi:hypothetical protein